MMLPNDGMSGANGIRKLVSLYRKQFRIPENLNHYSKEDLLLAERKFIKFALQDGHSLNRTESSMNH